VQVTLHSGPVGLGLHQLVAQTSGFAATVPFPVAAAGAPSPAALVTTASAPAPAQTGAQPLPILGVEILALANETALTIYGSRHAARC
jgi:hypothetical protein